MYASTTLLPRTLPCTICDKMERGDFPWVTGSEGGVRKQKFMTERKKAARVITDGPCQEQKKGGKLEGRKRGPHYIASFRTLLSHAARDPFPVRCCDRWLYCRQKSSVCQRGPGDTGMSVGLREFTRGICPPEQDETDSVQVRFAPSG